jgi:hypothetical protein
LDCVLNRTAGKPQLPNLLTSYPVRPPWQVAGVDYYVGVRPNETPLKDPTVQADLPAGATVDAAHSLIRITGNNVTLDGFDFSLHGGYSVYVDNASGTRITNSYFLGGVPVTDHGKSSNTHVSCDTIDGGGTNGNLSYGELLTLGPGAIVEYNWIKNAPQHFLSVSGGGSVFYRYNLLQDGGWGAGQHLNYLQIVNGRFINVQVNFNTMVQHATPAKGEGFQVYINSAGSIINGEIGYNTLITAADPGTVAESYIIHAGSNSQYPSPASGMVHDNYIDASGSYAAFYPNLSGFTYIGNLNLVTGAGLRYPDHGKGD